MTTLVRAMVFILFLAISFDGFGQPEIKFSQKEFNLQRVDERDGEVVSLLKIINTGDQPLVILDVTTGCNCTNVKFSKKPIQPKEEREIVIVFDPRRQYGTFFKTISIYSNTHEKRQIVTLRGEVVKN